MDQPSSTKNSNLISNAMELADNMLLMAQNGVPDCEDESCMMIYGIIRDCGYKIRRTRVFWNRICLDMSKAPLPGHFMTKKGDSNWRIAAPYF